MLHTLDHLILIWRILILMLQLQPVDIFGSLWNGESPISGIPEGGNITEINGADARMLRAADAATHKG